MLYVKGLMFPVSLVDITLFEKSNRDLSINVYGLKNKNHIVGLLYKVQNSKHINLLLL